MLNLNELPFRHLFDTIDGKTIGPTRVELLEKLVKQIQEKGRQLRPVAFQAISSDIPQMSPVVIKDMSADQRCLYEICQSVSTGAVPQELSMRSPEALRHARWLTGASRILRLYIGTTNIVMFLYAPDGFK